VKLNVVQNLIHQDMIEILAHYIC